MWVLGWGYCKNFLVESQSVGVNSAYRVRFCRGGYSNNEYCLKTINDETHVIKRPGLFADISKGHMLEMAARHK
jgi:hypothetical protein